MTTHIFNGGAYLSVFLETCTILWARRRTDATYIYLVVTTALMIILITTRCVIDTYRPSMLTSKTGSNGLNFGPPNTNIDIATNACWHIVTVVADSFISFRTFIVWNRNRFVIIGPSILCLANFGSSVWLLLGLKSFDPERGTLFRSVINLRGSIFISLTLATNLICTGLISFRIFYTYRPMAGVLSSTGLSNHIKIISILVESATMYTLFLAGALIAEGLNSYVSFIMVDCIPPTIGLVFSYIIIRVSRGTSYGENSRTLPSTVTRGQSNNTQTFELSTAGHNPPPELQVRLQRTTHQHSDAVQDADTETTESKGAKYGEPTLEGEKGRCSSTLCVCTIGSKNSKEPRVKRRGASEEKKIQSAARQSVPSFFIGGPSAQSAVIARQYSGEIGKVSTYQVRPVMLRSEVDAIMVEQID
ncbi:hypothetical protein B0H11DRAFT_2423502 [Mycena galericulata]|nr:hypothetical protein B0H11DRAFT_2423502 [Mycena galericulata]